MELDIKVFYLASRKHKAILKKLLILNYLLGLEGGAKVIKLMVVFRLLKRPILGAALLA